MRAVLLSEDALADTAGLFRDAVEHLAGKLGRVKPLDAASIPESRPQALEALAAWAGDEVTTWPAELARFYEEHIPLYLRPDQELNATLRALRASGTRLGAWSAGPEAAFAVILHQLGLARWMDAVRIGSSPRMPLELAAELGVEAVAVVAVTSDVAAASAAADAGMHVERSARQLGRLLDANAG